MTIEVDSQAAEIIRRVDEIARAQGESLGTYLQHTLPAEVVNGKDHRPMQERAWNDFVSGMTSWSRENLPQGFIADDSRDALNDDRA